VAKQAKKNSVSKQRAARIIHYYPRNKEDAAFIEKNIELLRLCADDGKLKSGDVVATILRIAMSDDKTLNYIRASLRNAGK